jgi:DNA (cytosine-5)-methyltransferase 1
VTAFYNEIDPYCAQWLRNLIDAGHIAPGVVDERSIEDITPNELREYTQCHFFAGIGVWSYALRLAGWPDDRPVWTGSCPCQPFSAAGKGHGFADERHLWPAWFHLIRECRPPVIFGEQVAAAADWIGLVRSDLEAVGYAVGAMPIEAASAGAQHKRDRMWLVADAERNQQPRQEPCGRQDGRVGRVEQSVPWDTHWPDALARIRVVDDGIARCVAATDAARNAIVPQAAAAVIRAYMEAHQALAARIAA